MAILLSFSLVISMDFKANSQLRNTMGAPEIPLFDHDGQLGFGQRQTIKFKLDDAGIAGVIGSKGTDWIRLEVFGSQIKVIHTTRTKNWLTQVQSWWDHPVRNIVFKPDQCFDFPSSGYLKSSTKQLEQKLQEYKRLYEQGLISEQEYQQLRTNALQQEVNDVVVPEDIYFDSGEEFKAPNRQDCLAYGQGDYVELDPSISLYEGEFKIDYREGGQWKTVFFRVPRDSEVVMQ